MPELENRVVLITGAKGGLGSKVTEACLAAGAQVIGTSKSIREGDFANPAFTAMPADLTKPAEALRLTELVTGRFGKLDAVVHVMGGFAGGTPIPETDDAVWESMISLNLRSALYLLRATIPHFRRAGSGRIVAIASRQGVEPQANLSAYNVSKAALVSLVRTAALENKDAGITANTILPGTMDTEANRKMAPGADTSRWVSTERVAALALFLISDAGAAITGAALPVYGSSL